MKKKIRAVIMIAAITLVTGANMFNSQRKDVLSDVALANVEALAVGESDGRCRTNADYSSICNYYDDGAICHFGF